MATFFMKAYRTESVIGSSPKVAAITPHDTNELAYITRGIWVGVAGNVKVTTLEDDAVTFVGAAAGTIIPVNAKIVWSAGTTATTMLAMF